MKNIDISNIRKFTKLLAPSADFDSAYTFHYDETNNIRKFYVREVDFNAAFTENFVLGGLVHEGPVPEVQQLIDSLKLQKSVKELKFKHLAKGGLIDCLKSQKIYLLLKYIGNSNLYIHYSSLNILYWSIVDIVDSAVAHSEASQRLGPQFANRMKNDLYKLAKLEIDSVISLFRRYGYPNLKRNEVLPFIEDLSELFVGYLDDMDFHFGLESLRQILKEAKKRDSMPFIMGGDDFLLIEDFSHFYIRPICLFKNSNHVFDEEESILELLASYKISDGSQVVNNFVFVNSASNQLIQLSDVVVGLVGKLSSYLNTTSRERIYFDFYSLDKIQGDNIDLLLGLIDRSHDKNIGFLHAVDAFEERSKIEVIRACRLR